MLRRAAASLCFVCCLSLFGQSHTDAGWPEYGSDAGGQRYSTATQINADNVTKLQPAWVFHTHALQKPATPLDIQARFEATPVLWQNTLYLDSPFDTVFALDALTGKQKWQFDPHIDHHAHLFNATARGVTMWHDAEQHNASCSDRVLVATIDERLIALDARDGRPCADFGNSGTVDLSQHIYVPDHWLLGYDSPPVVVKDNIILGSVVADNQTVNSPSGEVRAFDAHTGKQLWSWQPVRWEGAVKLHKSGSGNAWAPLSADPANDLVFVPTGSPAVDYYGALRVGDNRDADSIVALRASTGQKVWAYQLVHHDLWDYDTASQPVLFTFRGSIPAVAVTNKTGMIYVFNRLTGEPLYPIEERPVPKSDVPGEVTWPTQPFSTLPPLFPLRITDQTFTGSADARRYCTAALHKLRYEGLFTPPTVAGTLIFPSALGGPNWGSSALDPRTNVLYTRASTAAFRFNLLDPNPAPPSILERVKNRWDRIWADPKADMTFTSISNFRPPDLGVGMTDHASADRTVMKGTPYQMFLQPLIDADGTPCAPAPFGRLVATDLNTGKQLWSVAHGTMGNNLPGSFGVGGSIVTASKLIFVASTVNPSMQAYSAKDGRLLWQGALPATANATPMTYTLHNRQFVVIASGGHWRSKNDESDSLVAFALPALPAARKNGK